MPVFTLLNFEVLHVYVFVSIHTSQRQALIAKTLIGFLDLRTTNNIYKESSVISSILYDGTCCM